MLGVEFPPDGLKTLENKISSPIKDLQFPNSKE
jgi:hypothetical protein